MWKPTANIHTLKKRAEYLQKIRAFFFERSVTEIDVPVIGECSVTDPFLDALSVVEREDHAGYLQTSPEYFMKRLLAAGSGDIYYLGKAFRAEEQGRIHHREFTMLEWYREGFDDQALMREVVDLVRYLDASAVVEYVSYHDVFERYLGANPHVLSLSELKALAREKAELSFDSDDMNTWLDLLFTHCVEPNLASGLVCIFDYPESQAALARVEMTQEGYSVAKRFEVYLNGIELANGYYELRDAQEQRWRFEADNLKRKKLGKKQIEIDSKLMAAITTGLPDCAGVALGVDRLMMILLGAESIAQQRSF